MEVRERFEEALRFPNPYERLRRLALDFAAGGKDREEVLEIFESFRVQLCSENRDADDDALLEVMDCMVGWCSTREQLYPWSEARENRS